MMGENTTRYNVQQCKENILLPFLKYVIEICAENVCRYRENLFATKIIWYHSDYCDIIFSLAKCICISNTSETSCLLFF